MPDTAERLQDMPTHMHDKKAGLILKQMQSWRISPTLIRRCRHSSKQTLINSM